MKVAIHQPQYLPWLGFLDKAARADRFILLDDVQFARRNFQNRTRVATAHGPLWLTIPIHAPGHQTAGTEIRDLRAGADLAAIKRKHFRTLQHLYSRAPGWDLARERIADLLLAPKEGEAPFSLILASIDLVFELFGLELRPTRSSLLEKRGKKDELMLSLTLSVGGTTYLSGQGARSYMREEIFRTEGVAVEYQDFAPPPYRQIHGGPFVPGCSALDWFLCDPEAALRFAREV